MTYLVIENIDIFNPQLMLEDGKPVRFNTYEEARAYADKECHLPLVVPQEHALMANLQEAYNFVGMARFDLREGYDEGDLEYKLGRYFNEV